MKVTRITIADEQGAEQTLEVKDGTLLLLCEEDKILTQVSTNAAVNLEVMKQIFGIVPQPVAPQQTTPPVMAAKLTDEVPQAPQESQPNENAVG